MGRPKNITLFLMDGDANGRIMAELSNWTGKAYRIPRNYIKLCGDRKELDKPGIYILLSKGEDDSANCAYIGEAESVFKRLTNHCDQKDFWNEAIAFVSKDDKLNKAHIKYLEHILYTCAEKIERYKLHNTNIPTRSNISEPEEAEMDEFFDYIKLLTNTLGCKIFEPIVSNTSDTKNIFHISTKGIIARGVITNEGFVVLQGSQFTKNIANATQKIELYMRRRSNLILSNALQDSGDSLTAIKDILFTSPSAAAS